MRDKAPSIPEPARHGVPLDSFCALPLNSKVDAEILVAERTLAASNEKATIRSTPQFEKLSLPAIDITEINNVLEAGLESLESIAQARV